MQRKRILRALKPSGNELILYVLVSVILLVVTNQFVLQSFAELQQPGEGTLRLVDNSFDNFSQMLNQNDFLSKLTIGLLWSTIGAALYLVVWSISNALGSMRNNVVEDLYYSKPDPEQMQRDRAMTAGRVARRIAIAIFIVTFIAIFVQLLLPYAAQAMHEFSKAPLAPRAMADGASALVVIGLSIHTVVFLFRVLLMKPTLPLAEVHEISGEYEDGKHI